MAPPKRAVTLILVALLTLPPVACVWAGQVWTKCHITCRCSRDNTVGNFNFVIPTDRSPDIGFDADQACRAYGNRVCTDGCGGTKYSFTYKVTSP